MNLLKNILSIFGSKPKVASGHEEPIDNTMKYLIVGLGNIGAEYEGTRHNCGFMVVDAMAKEAGATWSLERHAYKTEIRHKGRTLILLKPTTYMNLSGKAVKYWMQAEKIELENLMIISDDIALPVGTIRMKKQGSGGGHNGLGNIEELLGTNAYPRLRIGVGDNFSKGRQIDYVLGTFSAEEQALLDPAIEQAASAIKAFVTVGADRAMNVCNTKKKKDEEAGH